MKLSLAIASAIALTTLAPTAQAITLCRDGTAMGKDSCRLHGGVNVPPQSIVKVDPGTDDPTKPGSPVKAAPAPAKPATK